jgi:DNA-binding transcriptional MerR regulator
MLNSLINDKDLDLDKEWEELILHALDLGISISEIRDFFNKHSRPV